MEDAAVLMTGRETFVFAEIYLWQTGPMASIEVGILWIIIKLFVCGWKQEQEFAIFEK